MKDRLTRSILMAVVCLAPQASHAEEGILSSQVGYEPGGPLRVILRSGDRDFLGGDSTYILLDQHGRPVREGPVQKWGEKWGSSWWIADFSGLKEEGTYRLVVKDKGQEPLESDPIVVENRILWSKCYRTMVYTFLEKRAEQARTKLGWRDCGSDLQEFSSHVLTVDALCDLIEMAGKITKPDTEHLLKQVLVGCEYLAHLQDRANELGLGEGAVVHEDRQRDVVTGNVVKGAMSFARVSRLLRERHPEKSAEYLQRAERAFSWIEKHGPVAIEGPQDFFPTVHGAPAGSVPPKDQWMTRDLVMMARAAIELFRAGNEAYQEKAVHYARRVMKRQVPRAESEDGLYGHFYTYDDYATFGGIRFTEKANIHCGAWSKEGRIYNKGGHYPHYLLPLMEMARLWPTHPDSGRWKKTLREFAYGYFLPACRRSPFLILPAGFYRGEGLLFFSGWYHAHNGMYGYAATLALEFERFFQDPQFREIATGNLQWVAGLNCGLLDEEKRRYVPVSMISGIGARFRGSWTKIPGSICNGFSASRQFHMEPAKASTDKPAHFDTEAGLHHTMPFAGALARLYGR